VAYEATYTCTGSGVRSYLYVYRQWCTKLPIRVQAVVYEATYTVYRQWRTKLLIPRNAGVYVHMILTSNKLNKELDPYLKKS